MSLYREKEANLAKAFSHLVQDSSDEENEGVPKSDISPSVAINGSEAQDTTLTRVYDTPPKSDMTNCIEEISILDDDDDVIEILDSSHASQFPTRRKAHERQTPEKRRSLSPVVALQESDNISLGDDYEFNLKVIVAGQYKQYSTTYQTKLSIALEDLITELKTKGKSLVVTAKDYKPYSLDETPQSLNLTPGTLLHAIEVTSLCTTGPAGTRAAVIDEQDVVDPDVIKVKLQDGHRRHMKEYNINKNDPVVKLKEAWSKEYNINVESIRLCFDGDVLSDDAKPEEFEIEEGCVIDVMLAQSR